MSEATKDGVIAKKKLSYLEAREYSTIEQRIAEAEAALEQKKAAAEDPSIATDAAVTQTHLVNLTLPPETQSNIQPHEIKTQGEASAFHDEVVSAFLSSPADGKK